MRQQLNQTEIFECHDSVFGKGQVSLSCPVFSALLSMDGECWLDWITVRERLQGHSVGFCSCVALLQTLRHSSQPPCHFSDCRLVFAALSFFQFPTLYYPDRARPLVLTFPLAGNLIQSLTNRAAKCKISKLLILQALMKWLAFLCCNYGKRSGP